MLSEDPPVQQTRPRDGATSTTGQDVATSLEGRVGVTELVLTVLAFSAPVVVVSGFTPFIIGFGGVGAPGAWILAMGVLLLFAVGYTTMTRYLPNPGAFYAYITAGLGRPLGLGSSFLAMLGYFLMAVGTYLFFGTTTQSFVVDTLNGPDIPWQIYSLVCLAMTATLGYFRIDLSAKVLSIAMTGEILIVLIFDLAVFRDGGPEGRSLTPFTWDAFTSGSIGLSVLFAATCFLGFEATAVFREETKNPRRTIPRATYLSVFLIGIFYILATWLIIVAYGPSQVTGAAAANPVAMFPDAMEAYVGLWARDVMLVLLVTSGFACLLSVQNILSRYCYSLGVDGALPKALGKVHPRHGSPYRSSMIVSVAILVAVTAFMGSDPGLTYGRLAGAGGFSILVLVFVTSAAIVVFFRRRKDIRDANAWQTMIAPGLSFVGMGVILYLAVDNFKLLTGGSTAQAAGLQVLIWSVPTVGIVLALVYRSMRPEVYARIGRQKVE
jgi:amino acid transporter